MIDDISFWSILTILSGVLVSVVVAITTYLANRSSMKVQEHQVGLDEKRFVTEEKFAEVDAAERLGSSYLMLVQAMESQLISCQSERRDLGEKESIARYRLQEERLLRKRIVAKICRLSEYHESLADNEISQQCPGFSRVQKVINEIMKELEGDDYAKHVSEIRG